MNNLYKRSLLRLIDLSKDDIYKILELSSNLKIQKKNGMEVMRLKGKNIVLIFEKDSTRTRCSFEVAAFDQGANVTYINSFGTQLGNKESIKDTARVLGRMYDAIQYRGYKQEYVEILSNYSGIPVWNGLTDKYHPTQLLADLLTIKEYSNLTKFSDIKLVYVGDIGNNISNTLLEASALTGINLVLIGPKSFCPKKYIIEKYNKLSIKNNGSIFFTEDIKYGVYKADFIYTDTWISMGDKYEIWSNKINLLRKYQVNIDMIKMTENPNVKFLHCLPSLHNDETIISKKISNQYGFMNGLEVTEDVFESNYSIVFDQAENRLHTIKALMISTLIR